MVTTTLGRAAIPATLRGTGLPPFISTASAVPAAAVLVVAGAAVGTLHSFFRRALPLRAVRPEDGEPVRRPNRAHGRPRPQTDKGIRGHWSSRQLSASPRGDLQLTGELDEPAHLA